MPDPSGISREVWQHSLSAFVQIEMLARQGIREIESGRDKLWFLIIISYRGPETGGVRRSKKQTLWLGIFYKQPVYYLYRR